MLRRFSTWFLITATVLALAGFIGVARLQISINDVKDRQTEECQATKQLERSINLILRAEIKDPSTSAALRRTIRLQEPIFNRALAASHHC